MYNYIIKRKSYINYNVQVKYNIINIIHNFFIIYEKFNIQYIVYRI